MLFGAFSSPLAPPPSKKIIFLSFSICYFFIIPLYIGAFCSSNSKPLNLLHFILLPLLYHINYRLSSPIAYTPFGNPISQALSCHTGTSIV